MEFKDYVKRENIDHVLIAVATPRANGQVERLNRDIIPMLAKLADDIGKWDKVIHKVEFAINNTVCSTRKDTPSRLLFGIGQQGDVSDILRSMLENDDNERNLQNIRRRASENIIKTQTYNEKSYNAKRKKAYDYKEGDYVMIRNVDTSIGVNKKLLPQFKGTYVVKKILGNDRYVITDVDGFQVTQIPYNGVCTSDQIKLYIKPNIL